MGKLRYNRADLAPPGGASDLAKGKCARIAVSLVIWLTVFLVPSRAWAQGSEGSPEQIRRLLGAPVVIPEAALFAASYGTFRDFCDRQLDNVGIIEGITRLEFGSLAPEDQETYKSIMMRQYQSNTNLWSALANKEAERAACRGLESTIIARAANFIRSHPGLFAQKEPQKIAKKPTFAEAVSEKLRNHTRLRKLYVFRVAENRVGDDMRALLKNPENKADGYQWVMKVLALEYGFMGLMTEAEFPEIGKIYTARAEIYSKFIRGELNENGLTTAENANEMAKNEIYGRLLAHLRMQESDLTPHEAEELNALAIEVGEMVIGQAKYVSVK
jgi:hypothetical protein